MIIPGQFGFNCPSYRFKRRSVLKHFSHRVLDPMEKCSNAFFSENTNFKI
jgi:hypothetical protein